MEPISVFGAAISAATVVQLCTEGITSLFNLQKRYSNADLTVRLLITQLSTLRSALGQVSAWMEKAPPQTDPLVLSDLSLSLDGCKALMETLNERLQCLEHSDGKVMGARRRAQIVWGEKERDGYLNLLNHSIAALQLFLTAIQCQTQAEQTEVLQKAVNREIIHQARDDSSSLLWLRDEESLGTRRSMYTENSEFLDFNFAFDNEVCGSKAYLAAMKSSMKRVVRDAHSKARTKRNRAKTISEGRPSSGDVAGLSDSLDFAFDIQSQAMLATATNVPRGDECGSSSTDGDFSQNHTAQNLDLTIVSHHTSASLDTESLRPAHVQRQALGAGDLLSLRSSMSSQSPRDPAVELAKSSIREEERILIVGNAKGIGAHLLQSFQLAYGKECESSVLGADGVRETTITRKSLGACRIHRFYDVLGLHSAEDRWLYSTNDMSAILFVVNISTYNVHIAQDRSVLCLQQDLNLFKQICATQWLEAVPILLLFGGTDQLASKIRRYPVTDFFADYTAGQTDEASIKAFFRQKFLALDANFKVRIRTMYMENIVTRKLGKSVMDHLEKMHMKRKVLSL
ncbi:MAG: hypothetical protein Q9170_004918 [Blastenia crenularia]